MLSSHMKISPLLWLHDKSRLSHQKTIKVKWFGTFRAEVPPRETSPAGKSEEKRMFSQARYFIDVYIRNRTLHGRLEIQNFSSRVGKIFHSFAALTRREISYLREAM